MARTPRNIAGGQIYHVLNRANLRAELFHKPADYLAFLKVLREAKDFAPVALLGYCLMPNHFHLLLRPPRGKGETLSKFMRFLSVTHTNRYHAHHDTTGQGHIYQGRFKSFPVADDRHFLVVTRYVERNPVKAGLVRRAEDWAFSSLAERQDKAKDGLLDESPVRLPGDWVARVNEAVGAKEAEALRVSMSRGRPFGGAEWMERVAKEQGLESSLRPRGRPRKVEKKQIKGS